MLTSLVEKLLCPTCSTSEQTLKAHVFTSGPGGHLRDGVLTCPQCRAWYPVEDDLLELVVAPLLNQNDLAMFRHRFRNELEAVGLDAGPPQEPGASEMDLSAQLKQREHFDWYAENTQQKYADYQKSPFWIAADEIAFANWKARLREGSWLLDVGCADGRSAFPFVHHKNTTVIGFDISKKLVRQAIERARAAGAEGLTTFFVGDGSKLAFRDQMFDYVVIYGVLHHLPNPGNACRDVARILKPGGVYFGSENNKSKFRMLFDLMMKLWPLWTEEAGEEPLISRHMVRRWLRGLPVQFQYTTSVFLPPHMFNLLGRKLARFLLPLTDRLCTWAPGLSNQGGLIVFEVSKPEAS